VNVLKSECNSRQNSCHSWAWIIEVVVILFVKNADKPVNKKRLSFNRVAIPEGGAFPQNRGSGLIGPL
jgi:hypothetical protein